MPFGATPIPLQGSIFLTMGNILFITMKSLRCKVIGSGVNRKATHSIGLLFEEARFEIWYQCRDVGTGGGARGARGAIAPTFWQTMQKCPFQIQKCPLQIHKIIIFTLILITFTLEGNFGILFFHSTFEIVYMN